MRADRHKGSSSPSGTSTQANLPARKRVRSARAVAPEPYKPAEETEGVRGKQPELLFHPAAWGKIQYFLRNHNGVEISGFGISSKDDLLVVEDFCLIKQKSRSTFVTLDDEAIADHVEDCVERGIRPDRCSRIWIHTHPGMGTTPSPHDNEVFRTAFGRFEWAIMCVFNERGASALLSLTIPVRVEIDLPPRQDYSFLLGTLDYAALAEEYKTKVTPTSFTQERESGKSLYEASWWDDLASAYGHGISLTARTRRAEEDTDDDPQVCLFCSRPTSQDGLNGAGICKSCEWQLSL
jgi:proteasome lid subunit RPN8/RPN11